MDSEPVTQLATPAAQPPAELSAACDGPAALPDAALSAGEVERGWSQDRAALLSCGQRHGAALQFYRSRDNGLAGR